MDTRFKRKLLLALGIRNYLALAIEFLSHNIPKIIVLALKRIPNVIQEMLVWEWRMKGNKGRNPRSKRLKFRFLPVTTINRDDEQRFLESHAFIIVSLLFYICSHVIWNSFQKLFDENAVKSLLLYHLSLWLPLASSFSPELIVEHLQVWMLSFRSVFNSFKFN